MPGIRFLHRVNRQGANRIDAERIDVLLAHCVSLTGQRIPGSWVQGLDAPPAEKFTELYFNPNVIRQYAGLRIARPPLERLPDATVLLSYWMFQSNEW